MKKLSFVLLVTLLLGLCSCAPKPNGAEIFDIKDPQYIDLSYIENTTLNANDLHIDDTADMESLLDLLNGLTLTEIEQENTPLNHYGIRIQGEHAVRDIIVSGSIFHCGWTGKVYRADKDITEELKGYLTRDIGTVSSGKDLFQTDSIARITVTNAQWEEIEMTDISQAVKALSALTLTRANTPQLEGGLKITLYLQDGSRIGITFGGNIMQVNNKAYRCDTDISQIFSQVVHPES